MTRITLAGMLTGPSAMMDVVTTTKSSCQVIYIYIYIYTRTHTTPACAGEAPENQFANAERFLPNVCVCACVCVRARACV